MPNHVKSTGPSLHRSTSLPTDPGSEKQAQKTSKKQTQEGAGSRAGHTPTSQPTREPEQKAAPLESSGSSEAKGWSRVREEFQKGGFEAFESKLAQLQGQIDTLRKQGQANELRSELRDDGEEKAKTALLNLGSPKKTEEAFHELFELYVDAVNKGTQPELKNELPSEIKKALNHHRDCFIVPASWNPRNRGSVQHAGKTEGLRDSSFRAVVTAAFRAFSKLDARARDGAFSAAVEWLRDVTQNEIRRSTPVLDNPKQEAATQLLHDALREPSVETRDGAIRKALETIKAGGPELFEDPEQLKHVLRGSILGQGLGARIGHRVRSEWGLRFDAMSLLRQAHDALVKAGENEDKVGKKQLQSFVQAVGEVSGLSELKAVNDPNMLPGVVEVLRKDGPLDKAIGKASREAKEGDLHRALVEVVKDANDKEISPEAIATAMAIAFNHNKHAKRHDMLGAAYQVLVVDEEGERTKGIEKFEKLSKAAAAAGLVEPRQVEGNNAQRRAVMSIIRAARTTADDSKKLEALHKVFDAVGKTAGVVDKHVLRGAFWKADRYDTAWLYVARLCDGLPRESGGDWSGKLRSTLGTLNKHKLELRRGQIGEELPLWGRRPGDPSLKAHFESVDRVLLEHDQKGLEDIAKALKNLHAKGTNGVPAPSSEILDGASALSDNVPGLKQRAEEWAKGFDPTADESRGWLGDALEDTAAPQSNATVSGGTWNALHKLLPRTLGGGSANDAVRGFLESVQSLHAKERQDVLEPIWKAQYRSYVDGWQTNVLNDVEDAASWIAGLDEWTPPFGDEWLATHKKYLENSGWCEKHGVKLNDNGVPQVLADIASAKAEVARATRDGNEVPQESLTKLATAFNKLKSDETEHGALLALIKMAVPHAEGGDGTLQNLADNLRTNLPEVDANDVAVDARYWSEALLAPEDRRAVVPERDWKAGPEGTLLERVASDGTSSIPESTRADAHKLYALLEDLSELRKPNRSFDQTCESVEQATDTFNNLINSFHFEGLGTEEKTEADNGLAYAHAFIDNAVSRLTGLAESFEPGQQPISELAVHRAIEESHKKGMKDVVGQGGVRYFHQSVLDAVRDQLGLSVVGVRGDGRCLYRALAEGAGTGKYRSEDQWADLAQQIVPDKLPSEELARPAEDEWTWPGKTEALEALVANEGFEGDLQLALQNPQTVGQKFADEIDRPLVVVMPDRNQNPTTVATDWYFPGGPVEYDLPEDPKEFKPVVLVSNGVSGESEGHFGTAKPEGRAIEKLHEDAELFLTTV